MATFSDTEVVVILRDDAQTHSCINWSYTGTKITEYSPIDIQVLQRYRTNIFSLPNGYKDKQIFFTWWEYKDKQILDSYKDKQI